MTGALIAVAALSLLVFLHPYITYPLSLYLFRERSLKINTKASAPSLALVFSAYNEERSLPAKIANLRDLKAAHPDLRIMAYCDLSSDRTLEMLKSASDVVETIAAAQRTGKATGMARMAASLDTDVVIFTDANVILDPASIDPIRRHFSDPDVGGLAGSLHYTNDEASPTARAGGLYWRLEEKVKQLESRCGSIMGADGSIFATRRSLYPVVPPHLLDDMTVSMSVPIEGRRLIFVPEVVAYEKNATAASDEFRRKRRIACRAFNTHRHLWPDIRARFGATELYKYVSHKLLRWFGLIPLAIFLITGAAALILSGQFFLLGFAGAAIAAGIALGLFGISPFSVVLQILVAVVATFFGITDSWKGNTYQTWTPAKSRA
ncbi:glycosyltransferase [Stakelama sp. CBK3Z-3]|uniref:Glycosyltransferase n=1 Tax=Stakelama flava TaxID=2860338 RepID=A0ABS6XI93_9SPHN|nr:glycosyltransferase [Stakelama flava]MBW4329906.1 glycosyltransferase [Stakelama flava]